MLKICPMLWLFYLSILIGVAPSVQQLNYTFCNQFYNLGYTQIYSYYDSSFYDWKFKLLTNIQVNYEFYGTVRAYDCNDRFLATTGTRNHKFYAGCQPSLGWTNLQINTGTPCYFKYEYSITNLKRNDSLLYSGIMGYTNMNKVSIDCRKCIQ